VRDLERSYSVTFKGETSELAISESERDLGIQVQPDLKWKEHTQICANKATRILGMLRNTFESRDCKLWANLFAIQA
jgi:hypothetical protein